MKKRARKNPFSRMEHLATRTTNADAACAMIHPTGRVSVGWSADTGSLTPELVDIIETDLSRIDEVECVGVAVNPIWSAARGMVTVTADKKHLDDAVATAAIAGGHALDILKDAGGDARAADLGQVAQWSDQAWANTGATFPPTAAGISTSAAADVAGRVTASFEIDLSHDFCRKAWWQMWVTLPDTIDVTITRLARPLADESGVRAGGILTVADNSVEEVNGLADMLIRSLPAEVRLRVRRMRGRHIGGRVSSALVGVVPWGTDRLECEV